MVKIVRGPVIDNVLCAAKRDGDDVYLYLPVNEVSAAMADAIADALTEALAPSHPQT